MLDLPSHRLPIVCEHLGVSLGHHHNAGADALAAAQVTIALARLVGTDSIQGLLTATFSRLGRLQASSWVGCQTRGAREYLAAQVPLANLDADPENPLYGQTVVFTGGLACMIRREASDCVAEAGGNIGKGVTKRTSLLVLGDGFRGDTLNDFLSTSKALKALEYSKQGQPIEFWTELDFIEALRTGNMAPTDLKPLLDA